jgi:hypothetical protein
MFLKVKNKVDVPTPAEGFAYVFIDDDGYHLSTKTAKGDFIKFGNTLSQDQLLPLTDCTELEITVPARYHYYTKIFI